MTIYCIHGIHTSDKDNVTAKLAPAFRQVCEEPVVVWKYGYALALTSGFTDFLNERRVDKLAKVVKPGDSILAHSNGCAIAYLLQNRIPIDRMILVQPALDNWRTFDNTRKVLVLYNEDDGVVGASTLGFCSAWGDMGKVGYTGSLDNVEKWNTKAPPHLLPPYSDHSNIVADDKTRQRWSMALARWMFNKKEGNNG